jgi:hypothetical protein
VQTEKYRHTKPKKDRKVSYLSIWNTATSQYFCLETFNCKNSGTFTSLQGCAYSAFWKTTLTGLSPPDIPYVNPLCLMPKFLLANKLCDLVSNLFSVVLMFVESRNPVHV